MPRYRKSRRILSTVHIYITYAHNIYTQPNTSIQFNMVTDTGRLTLLLMQNYDTNHPFFHFKTLFFPYLQLSPLSSQPPSSLLSLLSILFSFYLHRHRNPKDILLIYFLLPGFSISYYFSFFFPPFPLFFFFFLFFYLN